MTRTEKLVERRGRVILYLQDYPQASHADLAKAMRVSERTAQRDLAELSRAGLIRKRKKEGPSLEAIEKAILIARNKELWFPASFVCKKYNCTEETIRLVRQLIKSGQKLKEELTEEEIEFRQGQIANKECRCLKVLEGYEGVMLPSEMWKRYLEIREFKRVGKCWRRERALTTS